MPAVRSTASRKAEAEIATRPINVRPINGFIGAEIEGVDLRRPLSPAQFKIVHDALVQYEVIVMRDQDITVDQQMAFGSLFGELSIHPFSLQMETPTTDPAATPVPAVEGEDKLSKKYEHFFISLDSKIMRLLRQYIAFD